jgi:hypothetical protein
MKGNNKDCQKIGLTAFPFSHLTDLFNQNECNYENDPTHPRVGVNDPDSNHGTGIL